MILGNKLIKFETLTLCEDHKNGILDLIESGTIGENEDEILKKYEIVEEVPVHSIKANLAVDAKPNDSSNLDSPTTLTRYKYVGPYDDKNRTFCRRVLDAKLVFRKEDIDMMSFRGENKEFGRYSIFKYKGSYGCRHQWLRVVYRKYTPKGKEKEIKYNTPAQGF